MINKSVKLYIGNGYPVRIPVSQFDTMWQFVFTIIKDGLAWTIPTGATAVLNGLKPDGNVFAFSGTISGNTVTVECDIQMTAVAGDTICELSIFAAEGSEESQRAKVVGTANFVLAVEAAPNSTGATPSASELDAYGAIISDELDTYFEQHPEMIEGKGLSEPIRLAILDCFQHVAWRDTHGQDYYDTLYALLMNREILSITAVFNQGTAAIYTHDTLDDLRQYLTVTANYDDGTSSIVTTYTLSGELTAGTSTITATYSGKTTTFDVTVTQGVPSTYSVYDYITCTTSQGLSTPIAKAIILKQYANMNVLSAEFAVKPTTGHSDGVGIFGRRVAGTTGAASSYGLYAKIGKLSWQLHGKSPASDDYRPDIVENAINTIHYTNTDQSPSYLRSNNGTPITIDWENNNTLNIAVVLFSNVAMDATTIGIGSNIECGYIKFFDLSGDLVSHYIPVRRNSDNVVGMYDIVDQAFYTSSNTAVAKMGASGAIYAVGNW